MKNNLLYVITISLAVLSGCQSPDDIIPPADNQGLTRLTVKFTSGEYTGEEAASYTISDSNADTYVIPVPWFYPADSYNETTPYMTAMKVDANLDNNFTIVPGLSILDLTKDNHFTLTDSYGNKRSIIIKGERVKSSACNIITFSLKDKDVTGIIDDAAGTISLISIDDLSNSLADYELSPHALSISPDPAVTPMNFNNNVELTVTAHNVTSTKKYTVKKEIPSKIGAGYRKGSEENVYELNLSAYGFSMTKSSNPSLAVLGSYLVINLGDGTTPVYINRATGAKLGSVNIGSANAGGSITGDIYGNMLIANNAAAGGTLNVYKTKSVTAAPTLFFSMSNTTGFTIGSKMSVQGNLDGDAIIVATCENSSSFVRWIVSGGVAGTPQVISVPGIGTWGGADNAPRFTYASTNLADGYYIGHYAGGGGNVYYVDGTANTVIRQLAGTGDWARGIGMFDIKVFNNTRYMMTYNMGFFPQWALGGQIYMYDVTNPALVTGSVTDSPALTFKQESITAYNNGATPLEPRTADILLYPSADGFMMHMYYIDNASSVLGCYKFDCIDK